MNNKEKYYKQFLEGRITEQKYFDIFGTVGTSFNVDYFDHYDTIVSVEQAAKRGWKISKPALVDIKSIKKVARFMTQPNALFHWIEKLNISGYPGSAFGGKSTHLAFEIEDYFIHVSKEAIKEMCDLKLVDQEIHPMPDSYNDRKLHTLYRRVNSQRLDAIALFESTDLMRYSSFMLDKTMFV